MDESKTVEKSKNKMEDNEGACCQPVIDEDDRVSYTESEKITHLKLWEMSNTEELLRSWGEKAGGLRWIHIHSAHYWRSVDSRLNVIGITLSSLVSASSLAGAAENFLPQSYIMNIVGVIGLMNIINQSLQQFYNCTEKAALHDNAAKQFGNFYRYISTKLSMSRLERGPPKEVLDYAVRENERLYRESPDPHPSSVIAFKEVFYKKKNQMEFSIPDVVGDSFAITIYDNNPLYESFAMDLSRRTTKKQQNSSDVPNLRSFELSRILQNQNKVSENMENGV